MPSAPSPSAQERGQPEQRFSRTAVFLLMALGTLGQLALNIVLPSLPAIGHELAAAPGAERLVLSVFLIGFAGGQLLIGPLSDRFGRRIILLPGLVLYAALGIIAAAAGSLEWLLVARLVQGLGAAAGFVIARAIARDVFDGDTLVRVFGLLTLAMGITPGLAPIAGGFIQDSLGWQMNLAVTTLVGGIVAVICYFAMPETGKRSEVEFSPPQVMLAYVSIFKDKTFRRFAATNALTLGSLYAFHAGGPELMIVKLGLSPSTYGFLGFLYSGTFMLGAATAARVGGRISDPSKVIVTAAGSMLVSAIAMLALGVSGHATVVPVMVCMSVFGYGLGVVLPFGVAGALSPFKARAGAATALLGAMQMSAGAASSAIVAVFDDTPEIAFPAVMIVMTGAAILTARKS